ncbi:hypothetical protein GGI24_002235 [Coemansia furcata]|nr:hypothetical protein GGI24_002235 [Coemansia furcata]
MACYKYTRDKGHAADPLDAWTIAILEWADCSEPTANDDGESCSDSQYSDDSKSSSLKAYVIAPCFEAILLFVAHHIEAYFSKQIATGLHRSEDYRLILPIANEGTETDCTYFYSADHEDPYTIARVECGMFPLGSSVERQKTSLPHTIVADTEIAADKDGLGGAVRRLAMKTRELYCTQHNRIFAWGLTVASCTIHAYVFGLDDVWGSRGMDITVAEGRQALISLLVDWSLCSADRLRFDTSIRYALNNGNNNPCLELDVYDANESTGEVERHIHYSKQCIDASVSLTGRHARYFASSTDIATLGTPTFLIKDAWTPLSCGTRESSFLDFIHTTFDNSSELSGRFPRIVSTGPVFISRGDSVVEDSTETAFAGLPNISRVRQHRRTVTRWAGNRISAAADANQVIIAISDAMVAYNAAHEQCNLLHGNITDRAILFQETVDNGVSGVLAEFDYATFDGGSAGNTVEPETPELSMFSSIRSLEGAEVAPRTRLDDCESLLYLICVLGTFGVNRTEREKFAAVLPDILPIKGWNVGKAGDIADLKRTHMETVGTFETNIASKMRDLELRQLAVDLHHALFQHPGCSGACLTRKASLSDGSEQIDSSGSDPLSSVPDSWPSKEA